MFTPHRAPVFALSILLVGATPLAAAESIGKAVHIKTEVTGAGGEITVNDPVHQDERIRTSKSGLGQFVFRDGTKLAVGWGSSVVIDRFVFDGSRSVKQLTLKAAKGTFRWISGNSKHAAYEILTPAGTIGVRGTVFDFYIGADGTTAVVLLSGAASFCAGGECRQLTRRCDSVVARPNGNLSETHRVDRSIFNTLGNSKALPFLSGNQKLPSIGNGGGACGLRRVVEIKRDETIVPELKKARAAPKKPDKVERPVKDKPRSDHEGKLGGRDGPRDNRDTPDVDREKPRSDRERARGDHEGLRDNRDNPEVERETPRSDEERSSRDREGQRDGRDKAEVERETPRSDQERGHGDDRTRQDDHDRTRNDREGPGGDHGEPDGGEGEGDEG